MKKIVGLLAWLLLLTNLAWLLLASFHFVNTKEGWQVLGKAQMSLVDTFADARNWTQHDLEAHPFLAARLASANRQSVLAEIRSRPEPPAVQALPPLPPLPPPTGARPAPAPHPKSIFDDGINQP